MPIEGGLIVDAYEAASTLSLFFAALFAVLWYATPAEHVYETVELERVHTKKVFLLLTVLSLGAWLALLYYRPG